MDIDYTAMGRRIRAFRKERGMTQAAIADMIGKSTSYLGHIERGTRIASVDTLVKLSDALDITLDMLVKGADPSVSDSPNNNYKMRMLNNVLRVLNEHSVEWLDDDLEPKTGPGSRAKNKKKKVPPPPGGLENGGA